MVGAVGHDEEIKTFALRVAAFSAVAGQRTGGVCALPLEIWAGEAPLGGDASVGPRHNNPHKQPLRNGPEGSCGEGDLRQKRICRDQGTDSLVRLGRTRPANTLLRDFRRGNLRRSLDAAAKLAAESKSEPSAQDGQRGRSLGNGIRQ